MANKEEVKAQAEELGIEVQEDWTKAQIEEAIAEKQAESGPGEDEEKGEGVTIKNVYSSPFIVCGHRVMPGKTYELSEADYDNVKGMKRLENAIRKGYLEQV